MKNRAVVHVAYESFVTGFLHPLLTGGRVFADKPLSASWIDHFALAQPVDSEIAEDIHEAIHAAASRWVPTEDVTYVDRDLMALAMAAHNLAAATDPHLSGRWSKKTRVQHLREADVLIGAMAPPSTRSAMLARHAIADRFLDLRRKDVVVKNWAYTYRFFGRPVPPRVTAFPRARRVQQQISERPLVNIARESDKSLNLEERVRFFLSRSPFTEIVRADVVPTLKLGMASLGALSDTDLRSAASRSLSRGRFVDVAARLGAALRCLAARNPPQGYLRVALALAYEVHLMFVLDRADQPPEARLEELRRASSSGTPESPDAPNAASLFAALLPSLLPEGSVAQPILMLEANDLSRARRDARMFQYGVDEDALQWAAELVRRAVPSVSSHPPAELA